MSVTISNCDQICSSPLNCSKSKMLYTFSRGQRFLGRKIIHCEKFYDLGSTNSSRAAGFGYGHKYDFTQNVSKSPSPNKYQIKSQFSSTARKGFGFGSSREAMLSTGPFASSGRDRDPGPGAYPSRSTLACKSFSLKGKKDPQDMEKMGTLGPGSYPILLPINERGSYILSRYKNCRSRNFTGQLGRTHALQNKAPGPGAYDFSKQDLSPSGKYFNSKLKSSLVRTFGNSERENIAKNDQTPGPGNYRSPSQFGYYESGKKGVSEANKENQQPTPE